MTDTLAIPVTPLAQESLAVLVTSLAGRLNRGATGYYQREFGLAMSDFRVLLSLVGTEGLNVGELAHQAEVDKAAASRSLTQLEQRGLVRRAPLARSRGRAAIAGLTPEGQALAQRVRVAARLREERLLSTFTAQDRRLAASLLHRLIDAVPAMNRE